ncbi:MAG TPA: ABC transporter ATP-binding protein [Candidatus Krumholzibacteria bacterium]|nr:ABC transporter ATP-binding protein [Candidatus Krumholzibacteria bacterium]HRX51957.1 ABC transporter ATP-binding protein [Candidatus Krumholzibacteria bacterium]
MSDLLALQGVVKTFPQPGRDPRVILDGADLRLRAGEAVAVVGPSGSGKSTLLNLAAGLDVPDSGRVSVAGRDLAGLDDDARTHLRRGTVGIVFQQFHLLPHLSVRENVLLPDWIAGTLPDPDARALALLERVGLADRARDAVDRLSGGEQQRVALCRALLHAPRLLLADEPTGNLDGDSGARVTDLLFSLARDEGAGLLVVTHAAALADRCDRVLTLRHGRLEAS